MATKALAMAAVLLALAPVSALAQAVPPRVGPPVDYAGEGKRLPVIPPGTPTIGPPGGVPQPQLVKAPDPATTAEKIGTGASLGGATGTLVQESASKLARYTDTLEGAELASDLSKAGDVAGKTAKVVNLGGNVVVMKEKCSDPQASTSECLQAGLNMASSEASVIELLPAASKTAGAAAGALSVAADGVGLYRNCFGNADATKLDCIQSTADTLVSAGSMLPGGQTVAAGYSVAKTVLPAAVDNLGIALTGQSPGAYLYDKTSAAGADADAAALADSAANRDAQSQRRREAYLKSSGGLILKEEAYEAKQREVAERQAVALAAQAQASSQAAANQAFYGSLMGALQPVTQGGSAPGAPCAYFAPCATGIHTQADYDRLVAIAAARQASTARPSSTPAPSSMPSSGCGLTAADRQAGLVCTAK